MFWHSSKESAARLGAKVIAVDCGTSPADCWLSVTVCVPTATTVVPALRPVPLAVMPGLTPATEPKLRTLAPGPACALVESVTPEPGSAFRTACTAVSKASKGGGVPSAGI